MNEEAETSNKRRRVIYDEDSDAESDAEQQISSSGEEMRKLEKTIEEVAQALENEDYQDSQYYDDEESMVEILANVRKHNAEKANGVVVQVDGEPRQTFDGRIDTTTLNIETTIGGGDQPEYRFYKTDKHATTNKICLGYVLDAKYIAEINKLLAQVRNGQHRSVAWYALATHPKAPCAGLFEEPTDHYHLIVWFADSTKPTDLAFHRRFYNWVNGKEWKSEIASVRAILQYIQCEPRQMIELYSNNEQAIFLKNCWETRHEMQEKIKARDAKKKAKAITTRVNIADENDWWVARDCNPQAIVKCQLRMFKNTR